MFPLPKRAEHEGSLYDQVVAELAEYDYVVRDLGVLDAERLRELYRAQCAVVVGERVFVEDHGLSAATQ